MNSRRLLSQRQPSEYQAVHQAKVDAKLAEGKCRYIDCDAPLAPTSKHYCAAHLSIRTQRQRDKREGNVSKPATSNTKDPIVLFAREIGRPVQSTRDAIWAGEVRETIPELADCPTPILKVMFYGPNRSKIDEFVFDLYLRGGIKTPRG